MSNLQPLKSHPMVKVGGVDFVAIAAARTDKGLEATVQMANGRLLASDTISIAVEAERGRWAAQHAEEAHLSAAEIADALLQLNPAVEKALRELPDIEAAPIEWGPVISLEAPAPAMAFPVKALVAPVLMNFVHAVARAYNVPLDFPAAGVLGALSGALGLRRQLWLGGEWYSSACLWIVAVGRSGSGKSEPIVRALRPLRKHHEEKITLFQMQKEDYAERMAEWEQPKSGRQRDKKANRGSKPKEPVLDRVLVSNITVEALASELRIAPAGVLLYRDELAGLIASYDQYRSGGKGSDRAAWLEMYQHRPIDIARKTGDDRMIYVPRPFVAIVGTIQPARFRELVGDQDDGLSPRFLLCYPDTPILESSHAYVNEDVEDAYETLIRGLLALPYDKDARATALSVEAMQRYRELNDAFRREWPPEESSRLDEALNKLCLYAGRLTNVLLVAAEVSGFTTTDTKCVEAAWELVGYFRQCAMRMYAAVGQRHDHARRIVGWIERGQRERFSGAELLDDLQATLKRGEPLEAAFTLLEERQYIRLLPQAPRSNAGGRPPSARYLVNPEIYRKNPKNPKNPPAAASSKSGFSGSSDRSLQVESEQETAPDKADSAQITPKERGYGPDGNAEF